MVTKLNVGCGDNRLEGYINIDAQESKRPNIVAEGLRYVSMVDDNTVDEVRADQFVEHLSPANAKEFICQSKRILVPGGKLTIECPDIAKVAIAFAERRVPYWRLLQSCFGGEGGANTEYGHRWGYSVDSMRLLLLEFFEKVVESEVCGPSSVEERDFHLEAIK